MITQAYHPQVFVSKHHNPQNHVIPNSFSCEGPYEGITRDAASEINARADSKLALPS